MEVVRDSVGANVGTFVGIIVGVCELWRIATVANCVMIGLLDFAF